MTRGTELAKALQNYFSKPRFWLYVDNYYSLEDNNMAILYIQDNITNKCMSYNITLDMIEYQSNYEIFQDIVHKWNESI